MAVVKNKAAFPVLISHMGKYVWEVPDLRTRADRVVLRESVKIKTRVLIEGADNRAARETVVENCLRGKIYESNKRFKRLLRKVSFYRF